MDCVHYCSVQRTTFCVCVFAFAFILATVYNSEGSILPDAISKGAIVVPLEKNESWKKISIHLEPRTEAKLPKCVPLILSKFAKEVRMIEQADLVCRFHSLSNTRALLHLNPESRSKCFK